MVYRPIIVGRWTAEMQDGPVAMGVDPLGLLASFGVSGVRSLAPVTGGWDTSIWQVESSEGTFALRVLGQGRVKSCRTEVLAMQIARSGGIPVPFVHAQVAAPECSALLLDWVSGRPILEEMLEKPDRVEHFAMLLGRMQARIHSVAPPAGFRESGRSWIEWAGPDEELKARLRALDLRDNALLHLDYNVMNVMADAAGITGVLDWSNAGVGDPRADLARTFTMLALGPPPPDMSEAEVEEARRQLVAAWMRGYQEVAGSVGDLSMFYPWAGGVMLRDLPQHLGKPGVPLTQAHLDRVEDWTLMQRKRVGLAPIF